MPAVRDVATRFIVPSCRHAIRWAMCTNCCREPWPPGLSPRPPRPWVESRTGAGVAFLVSQAGRRPRFPFSRPAQAYCALRPAGLLAQLSLDFVTRLPRNRLPGHAARQLPCLPTTTLLMFAKYSVGAQRAAPALARHLLCPKTTLYSAGINRWAPSSHKVSAPKRRTEKGGLANGFQPVGDPAGQLVRGRD